MHMYIWNPLLENDHAFHNLRSVTEMHHGWDEYMMTSSNGNIFRVTGPLWGESTGHWWIPLTKANDAELWCSFICAWTHGQANNRDAGDLRRHGAHNDVTVMTRVLETQATLNRLHYASYEYTSQSPISKLEISWIDYRNRNKHKSGA